MSFHIYVKNNREVTFSELLEHAFLPENTMISYGKEEHKIIKDYSKLYVPFKSSRGVAITVDDENYDIELNTGASEEDYYLSTRIALVLSALNNADINPEFDDSLSAEAFEKEYNREWAKQNELNGISTLIQIVNKLDSTMQLNGCKRPFYIGKEILREFQTAQISEKEFATRIIENIIEIQFLENLNEDIVVPTLMEADFPEGVQTFISIAPNFTLLLIKADCIILRDEEELVKVNAQDFLEKVREKGKLKRVDEEQYIMQPLNDLEYKELIRAFSEKNETPKKEEKKRKSKWKFWK